MQQEWLSCELELDKLRRTYRHPSLIKAQIADFYASNPYELAKAQFEKRKRLLAHRRSYVRFAETYESVRAKLRCCSHLGVRNCVYRHNEEFMKIYKVFSQINHNNVSIGVLMHRLVELDKQIEPIYQGLVAKFDLSRVRELPQIFDGDPPFGLVEHVANNNMIGVDGVIANRARVAAETLGGTFKKRIKYSL